MIIYRFLYIYITYFIVAGQLKISYITAVGHLINYYVKKKILMFTLKKKKIKNIYRIQLL